MLKLVVMGKSHMVNSDREHHYVSYTLCTLDNSQHFASHIQISVSREEYLTANVGDEFLMTPVLMTPAPKA